MRRREHIRSNMRSVRAKGSRVERMLGSALWRAGLRYRKHYPILGKPDFALVSTRIAVFCDSRFWHGYDWANRKHDHKRNVGFWHRKIERNMARDTEVTEGLRAQGWSVFRFWDHEVKADGDGCAAAVLAAHSRRQKEFLAR